MFTWNNCEYIESDEYKNEVLIEPFLLEDILDILKHVSSKHKVEFIPQRIFEKMKHCIIFISILRVTRI